MSTFFSCFTIEGIEISKRLSNFAKTTEESVAEPGTKPTVKSMLWATVVEPRHLSSICPPASNVLENFADGDLLYTLLH